MTAAAKDETFVAGLAPHVQTTGKGMKCAAYTVTIANQNDWVIFSDFSEVKDVYATVVSTGVHNATTIDGTDKDKVVYTSATTGAMKVIVWGY